MKRIKYVFDDEVYWYTLTIGEGRLFDFLIQYNMSEDDIVNYFKENARKNYEMTKMLESNPEYFKKEGEMRYDT